MGGAIGLKAAGRPAARAHPPHGAQRHRAASWPAPLIQRIRSYAGSPPAFATVSELEQYFRSVYQPYGAMSDAQWRHLTETSMRRLPDGRVTPHYDPAMVQQFTHHPDDYATQWDAWDALDLPVLCLRGEHSDLLLPEVATRCATAAARTGRHDRRLRTRPALNTPSTTLVERFLSA